MLAALVLTALGVAAYFLPVYLKIDDLPVLLPLVLLALGAFAAWAAVFRQGAVWRGVVASFFTIGVGVVGFWHFRLSVYPDAPSAPDAGKAAPFREILAKDRATLLIFFRGAF
jgi:hypothetical protein